MEVVDWFLIGAVVLCAQAVAWAMSYRSEDATPGQSWMGIPSIRSLFSHRNSIEIARELAEAQALREEAERMLEHYERKRADAQREAQAIVDAAKEQASLTAQEIAESMRAAIARREAQAEQRISAAYAHASDEVRAAAAEAAIAAAEKMIRDRMTDEVRADLLQSSLDLAKQKAAG